MFRKIAITGGAVLLGLVIVSYTSLPSLLHVKWNDTMAWLDRQVPIETQIKQLRLKVDHIDKQIKGNLDKLAKMETESQNLDQRVIVLKEAQANRKSEIASLTKQLTDDSVKVKLNEKHASTNRLDALVSEYEGTAAKLKGMEQLAAAKRETLNAAHKSISSMKEERDALRVTIARLESRKELVDIKTQHSEIQISDNKINECNALAKQIDDRLTEQEKRADLYAQYGYSDTATAVEKNSTKSVKEVLNRADKILAEDQESK